MVNKGKVSQIYNLELILKQNWSTWVAYNVRYVNINFFSRAQMTYFVCVLTLPFTKFSVKSFNPIREIIGLSQMCASSFTIFNKF